MPETDPVNAMLDSFIHPRDDCLYPPLRSKIIQEDRDTLHSLLENLLSIGTVETCTARLGPITLHTPQDGRSQTSLFGNVNHYKIGALPCVMRPSSSTPPFDSWEDTIYYMDEVCKSFRQHMDGRDEETPLLYGFPLEWQEKTVPFMYNWLTNFDFFLHWSATWGVLFDCYFIAVQRDECCSLPTFHIPWKPTAELMLSFIGKSNKDYLSEGYYEYFKRISATHSEKFTVFCRISSVFFHQDALVEQWDYFAPFLKPSGSSASVNLALFGLMLPVRRVVDPQTRQLVPLMSRIIRFLLVESQFWHQQGNSAWLAAKHRLLSQVHFHLMGAVPMDEYAEPIFSDLLNSLRLPIGDQTKRSKDRMNFGRAAIATYPIFNESEYLDSQTCLVYSLSNDTTSPLWNHLRRFVHATDVFLRPGSNQTEAHKVFTIYSGLVMSAYTRVRSEQRQQKSRRRAGQTESNHAWAWGLETRKTFAAILTPVVLPSLYMNWGTVVYTTLLCLASLDPEGTYPQLMEELETGLHYSDNARGQGRAVVLLNHVANLYLLCPATYAPFTTFLKSILSNRVLHFISGSSYDLNVDACVLIAKCVSQIPRGTLFEDEVSELEFMTTFFANLKEAEDSSSRPVDPRVMKSLELCLRYMSESTFQHIADKVLRDAVSVDTGAKRAHLLTSIARRDSDKVLHFIKKRLFPILKDGSTNDGEIQNVVKLINAGIAGSGQSCVGEVHVLFQCVHLLSLNVTSSARVECARKLIQLLCMVLTSVQTRVTGSTSEAQPEEEDLTHPFDTSLYRQMQYYTPAEAELEFTLPTSDCCNALADLLDGLIGDIMFVAEHIEEVACPSAAGCSSLRDLVPPKDGTKRDEGRFTLSETALPFTPHNVLVGLSSLLQIAVLYYPFEDCPHRTEVERLTIRTGAEDGEMREETVEVDKTVSVAPEVTRATWPLFSLKDRTLKYSREAIFAFAVKHFLARFVSNYTELTQVVGRSVAQLIDLSEFEGALPPFPERLSKGYDAGATNSFACVLSGLLGTGNYATTNQAERSSSLVFFPSVNAKTHLFCEAHYYPSWHLEWKSAVQLNARREQHTRLPRRVVARHLNIFNVMIYVCTVRTASFSPLKHMNDWTIRLWMSRSVEFLTAVGQSKIQSEEGVERGESFRRSIVAGVSSADAEAPPPATALKSPVEEDEDEEEMTVAEKSLEDNVAGSQLKKLFNKLMILSVILMQEFRMTSVEEFLATIRLFLLYPDALMTGKAERSYPYFETIVSPALLLGESDLYVVVEELIGLAHYFVHRSPRRAEICLKAAKRIFRLVSGVSIKPEALRLLLKMCQVSSFGRFHEAAGALLSEVLLAFSSRPRRVTVLMRPHLLQENMEENTRVFQSRWEKLSQRSFCHLKGDSIVFPSRQCVVDGEVEEDFFGDGFPALAPMEIVVRQYSLLRTTPTEADLSEQRNILTDTIPRPFLAADEPHLLEDSFLESTFLWKVIRHRVEVRSSSYAVSHKGDGLGGNANTHPANGRSGDAGLSINVLFWNSIWSCFDPSTACRVARAVTRTVLSRTGALLEGTVDTTMDVLLGWITTLVEVTTSLLCVPIEEEQERRENTTLYYSVLSLTCSSKVPGAVERLVKKSISAVYFSLEELQFVLGQLFEALAPLRDNMKSISPTHVRVLLYIYYMINSYGSSKGVSLLPFVLERVFAIRPVFFCATTTVLRSSAASILRAVMNLSHLQSDVRVGYNTVTADLLAFIDEIEKMEPTFFADVTLTEVTTGGNPSIAPWGATPALTALHKAVPSATNEKESFTPVMEVAVKEWIQPTGEQPIVPPTPALTSTAGKDSEELGGFSLDACPTPSELMQLKSLSMTFWMLPQPLLERKALPVLRLLTRVFDLTLTEVDQIYSIADQVLVAISFTRLSKTCVNEMITFLHNTLVGRYNIGQSRRARVALTKSLRLIIFSNLHRIGKYAVMTDVAEAALSSMAHGDGELRVEGRLLFSVLMKVASEVQIRSLLHTLEKELRGMTLPESTPDRTPSLSYLRSEAVQTRRRRDAIVLAFCSTVGADPARMPSYVPHLLEKLAHFIIDGTGDIKSAVKKTFEEWWRAHRDGWDTVYKKEFTPQQIDTVMDLLKSPYYYA